MFNRVKSGFQFALFLVALNAVAIAQSAKELADPIMSALRNTGGQSEIPDLLRRLAKARQNATKEEGEKNRYKLVVVPSEATQ